MPLVLPVVGEFSFVSPALGQQSTLTQRQSDARDAYDRAVQDGLREYQLQRYVPAREAFARAHGLRPSARTLRGLGVTDFALNDYTRARQELQDALASADNPLTARVIVNRVWQQHFGQGLVRSANDFGLMGTPPTHPELLDWLARWFVRDAHGSLKNLHRLILSSSTWRTPAGSLTTKALPLPFEKSQTSSS